MNLTVELRHSERGWFGISGEPLSTLRKFGYRTAEQVEEALMRIIHGESLTPFSPDRSRYTLKVT